ncbi:hypothetical protein ACTWQB_04950 [Piscibacillus sp. B03]
MQDSWSAKNGHVLWPTPTLDRPGRRRTARAEGPQDMGQFGVATWMLRI